MTEDADKSAAVASWILEVRNFSQLSTESNQELLAGLTNDMTHNDFVEVAKRLLSIAVVEPEFGHGVRFITSELQSWYVKVSRARSLFREGYMLFASLNPGVDKAARAELIIQLWRHPLNHEMALMIL